MVKTVVPGLFPALSDLPATLLIQRVDVIISRCEDSERYFFLCLFLTPGVRKYGVGWDFVADDFHKAEIVIVVKVQKTHVVKEVPFFPDEQTRLNVAIYKATDVELNLCCSKSYRCCATLHLPMHAADVAAADLAAAEAIGLWSWRARSVKGNSAVGSLTLEVRAFWQNCGWR